jgi:hypothetical protein
MLENKFISGLIGIAIYILGIYIGHIYWFSEDVKNGSGLLSLFSVLILCGIGSGLFVVFNPTINQFKNAHAIPFLIPLGTFTIMWFYHNSKRDEYLKEDGGITYGIVTFKDKVFRSKTSNFEIRYKYKVENTVFKKYDTDKKYIEQQNIEIGDTLVIKFWNKNPNYHSYGTRNK